jgi:hemerythrin
VKNGQKLSNNLSLDGEDFAINNIKIYWTFQPPKIISDEFLGFLTDWFVGHTIYEDQKFFKVI